MTRFVARHVPLEMAALWVAEVLLSALVFLAAIPGAPTFLALSGGRLPDGAGLPGGTLPWAVALALLLGTSGVVLGLYRPKALLERRLLLNLILVAVLAFPVALLIGGRIAGIPLAALLSARYTPLGGRYAASLLTLLALWLAVTLLVRGALRLPFARRLFVHRVLVVGPDAPALRAQLAPLAAGRFTFSDPADPSVGRPWAVLLATSAGADAGDSTLGSTLRLYRQHGARIFDRASFAEHCLSRIDLTLLSESWFLTGDGFTETRLQAAARRALDLSVSFVLLALTFPLMLAVALAISFESSGPVLYRQERVGRHGVPFTLFKFRSMRADAEKGGLPRWASPGDSRVTRIGRIIRATRIDELPQLVNVLRGEMSLVGPRPERPHFVEQLAEVIPFYRERSLVKPGVTGWAQINYPYGASVEDAREKLAYDLYYIKHRSLLLDVLVMFGTIRVVLLREGAR